VNKVCTPSVRTHSVTSRGQERVNKKPSPGFPFALVARLNERFVVTGAVVAGDLDDLDERPDLSPWVAAFWDQEHR
jgi:hypothetical protein